MLYFLVITVPRAKHGSNSERIYDATHVCYFCNAVCSKIARHYLNVHRNEREVLQITAINCKTEDGRKRRKLELDRLRFRGDFYHNMKVLATGGELKVWRRPSPDEVVSHDQFKPCMYCFAFVQKHELWRHTASCPMNDKKGNTSNRKLQHESDMILFGSSDALLGQHPALSEGVLSSMKGDEIAFVVKHDPLILAYGSYEYSSKGKSKANYVSQKMRILAKFLLELQKDPHYQSSSLAEILKPETFDDIIKATRNLCSFTIDNAADDIPSFKVPSLALRIGYALKQCAVLQRGLCLRTRDSGMLENLRYFLDLYEAEWTGKISSIALTTLDNSKFKAPKVLPVSSDLVMLRGYLFKEMASSIRNLKLSVTLEDWRKLAEATVTRLIIFNKRRANEVAKLAIAQYLERPLWNENGIEEVQNSLQPLEKELCERYIASLFIIALSLSKIISCVKLQ